MATNNEAQGVDPNKNLKLSIGLFSVVVVCTLGIFFFNKYIASQIEEVNMNIMQVTSEINQIQTDKKVELLTLIQENQAYLDKYKKLSNIPAYISNVKKLALAHKIKLLGFGYDAGKISAKFTATTDENSFAFVKTKNFFEYFRKNDEDIFKLDFVNTLTGQDEITFGVNFEVK